MHGVKVSWVGQTFALAKCSDSGGKKSRIRRSKEERKSMVESFIKKYQKSNNGSFPSLNLTHKEVGGSFYTVREIVREIIQENRVLGPAKLTSEEHSSDRFSEEYPLGSISTKPQNHLFSSSDKTLFVSADHEIFSVEKVSISTLDLQSTSPEPQTFENGRLINGKWMDEENKDSVPTKLSENGQIRIKVDDQEVQISEKLGGVKNVAEESVAKVTPMAGDVIVETFPLRAGTKPTFSMDEKSEAKVLTEILEESTMVEVAPNINGDVFDRRDSLEKNSSGLDDKLAAAELADQLLESVGHPTDRTSFTSSSLEVDVPQNDVLTLQTSDQYQVVEGIEPKYSPPDVNTKNVKATNSSSTCLESLPTEAAENKTKANTQNGTGSSEGATSTLNRINLLFPLYPRNHSRSWDSKKSAKEERNPVWAVFIAFLDAFVKFWSE